MDQRMDENGENYSYQGFQIKRRVQKDESRNFVQIDMQGSLSPSEMKMKGKKEIKKLGGQSQNRQTQSQNLKQNNHKNIRAIQSFKSQTRKSFILRLLQLQENWIKKEDQITKYVQTLKKTAKVKDEKVQDLETSIQKLNQKAKQLQKQNTQLKNVYVGMQRQLKQLRQNKRSQDHSDQTQNFLNKSIQIQVKPRQLTIERQSFNQFYRPEIANCLMKKKKQLEFSSNQVNTFYLNEKQQLTLKKQNSRPQSEQQISSDQETQVQSALQEKIMNKLLKMFEQNFQPYQQNNRNSQQYESSSSVVSEQNPFFKKNPEIRQTSATEQTFEANIFSKPVIRPMMKKNQIKQYLAQEEQMDKRCEISQITIGQQRERQSQKRKGYKSSKTITFSNDPQQHVNIRDFEENEFHSQNKIKTYEMQNMMFSHGQSGEVVSQTNVNVIQDEQQQAQEIISQVETVKKNSNLLEDKSKVIVKMDPLQIQGRGLDINRTGQGDELKEKVNIKIKADNVHIQGKEKRDFQINAAQMPNKYYSKIKTDEIQILGIQIEKQENLQPQKKQYDLSFNKTNQILIEKNNSKNDKNSMKLNLSSQKFYEKSIMKNQQDPNATQVNKESPLNSEDDKFQQPAEQSSRKEIISVKEDRQNIEQRNENRRRTKMNTKFTNLDYSLTQSNVSVSQIDGSQFRNKQNKRQDKNSSYESFSMTIVGAKKQQAQNKNAEKSLKYDKEQKSYSNMIELEQQVVRKNNVTNVGTEVNKNALKIALKARLLVDQNLQTEPKSSGHSFNKQIQTDNSNKKILISSNSSSKLYQPQKINSQLLKNQQKSLKNFHTLGHQLDFNKSDSYSINPTINKKEKKYEEAQIQYENSAIQQFTEPENNYYKGKKQISNNTFNVQIDNKQSNKKISQSEHYDSNNFSSLKKPQTFTTPKFYPNSIDQVYSPTNKNRLVNQRQNKNLSQNNNYYAYEQLRRPPKSKQSNFSNFQKISGRKSESFMEENTKLKEPYFDDRQFQCYTASNKSNKSAPVEEDYRFSQERSRLFAKQRVPQTKSTTLKQRSQQGNNLYLQNSVISQSQQPFQSYLFKKKPQFTNENCLSPKEREQQLRARFLEKQKQKGEERQSLYADRYQPVPVNLDKILFQNSMLKSYNKTLQNKAKKSSKIQKLMEKFNSQNVSIRNKIHKKSIS